MDHPTDCACDHCQATQTTVTQTVPNEREHCESMARGYFRVYASTPAQPASFTKAAELALAPLLQRERQAAVEAATPEIKRRARIEALQWAKDNVSANSYGHDPADFELRVREDIDAELERLEDA